jgi:hypothetical protein
VRDVSAVLEKAARGLEDIFEWISSIPDG